MRFRIPAFLFLLAVLANANPVAIPDYAMTGENVLVSISNKGAVVSGSYRFRVAPYGSKSHRRLFLTLPVPVSSKFDGFDDAMAELKPFMVIDDTKYLPIRPEGFGREKPVPMFYFTKPPLPAGMKLAGFEFYVSSDKGLPEQIDVKFQYIQPAITTGGRRLIYYVPCLPQFNSLRKEMGLVKESYLVTFQALDDATLHLATPEVEVVKAAPKAIQVRPRDMQPIAVEELSIP